MAVVAARPGIDEILAVGRLSRSRRSQAADVSLVVSDAWQSRGIGRQLLDLLIEIGRAEGLERLTACMLSGNQPMADLCQKHGFQPTSSGVGEFTEMVLKLRPPTTPDADEVWL